MPFLSTQFCISGFRKKKEAEFGEGCFRVEKEEDPRSAGRIAAVAEGSSQNNQR